MTPSALDLSLSGLLTLRWQNEPVALPPRWDACRLLVYLTTAAHTGYSVREQMADDLWPTLEPALGRKQLRLQLHVLKSYLTSITGDSQWWTASREWLRWCPETEITSDYGRFTALAHRALDACAHGGAGGNPRAVAELRLALRSAPTSLLADWPDPWLDSLRMELDFTCLRLREAYRIHRGRMD